MNVKKIIKGIIGLGAIGGVAYAAYKLGESDGRFNEIHRRMTENGDEDDEDIEVEEDDDYRFYDNYDEPDDECLAPKKEYMPTFTVSMHNFAPLDSVKVDGISDRDIDMLIFHISLDKYTSNKQIREWLKVDKETAAKVIAALREAEYIGEEYPNYIIPVHITTEVYFRLRGDLR
jgi:predicted HTH transcriptional regulator